VKISLIKRPFYHLPKQTMKFSLIALAGALTAANAASSVVPKTFKLNGKRNLRRGDASTEALLQKAVPYNRKNINRHLQEEDDAAAKQGEEEANDAAAEEEAAVEPSSTSTISFGKCVDVKTRDENLFSEDLVEQVQAGNVMSLKSYVLFNVCDDTYGYGCSESNSVEYMVDLSTYLSVVGMKQANLRTDYCEQCNRFQDSCAAAAEEEEEQADAEEEAVDEEAVDEEQEGEEVEREGEEEQGKQEGEEAMDEQEQGEQEQEGSKDEQEQEGEEAMDEQEQGEQEQEGSKDEQEQEGEEAMDEQEQGEQEQEQEREQEQEQKGSKDQQEGEQEQEFEEEKEQQDAQAYGAANGNGRKLKQQIDCNQCESLQCFADDAENGQADIDKMVAEWIEEVANCKATDQYVNGMQVYLGPICSDGLYFEIGAFLNEVSLSKVIYYFFVVALLSFSLVILFYELLSNVYYRTVPSTPILHRTLKSLLPNKITTTRILLHTQSTL
jgi:hypothetical protein